MEKKRFVKYPLFIIYASVLVLSTGCQNPLATWIYNVLDKDLKELNAKSIEVDLLLKEDPENSRKILQEMLEKYNSLLNSFNKQVSLIDSSDYQDQIPLMIKLLVTKIKETQELIVVVGRDKEKANLKVIRKKYLQKLREYGELIANAKKIQYRVNSKYQADKK